MIDANSQFFAMLTAVGEAKQVKADAGQTWKLTHMAVGDANNTDPIPDRLQKSLINERRRAPLNSLGPDPSNPGILVAEQFIPADEGGFWIRELGLFDSDGDLVAVANCAPSFKPKMSQGSGRTQTIRMNFVVKSSNNVVLLIDPAVVTATRKFVEDSVANAVNTMDCKASVLVATTAQTVLAGVQTIDAVVVPAGSRILVKNQNKPSENGIYLVTSEAWVRAVDADNDAKVSPGMQVVVERGTVNADTLWLLATDGPIVLGTTALTFKNVIQGLAPINSPAFVNPTGNTPEKFDSSKLLVNTEFFRQNTGSYSGVATVDASRNITASDIGKLLWFSGKYAIGIVPPSTLGLYAGGAFEVFATAVGGSLLAVGGVGMMDQAGTLVESFSVNPGQSVKLVANSSNQWVVISSTAGLAKNSDFAALLGTFGHIQHPSGLIEQWVNGTSDANGILSVTLPKKFPNKILGGIANERSPGGWTTGFVTVWGFDLEGSTVSTAAARVRGIVQTSPPSAGSGLAGTIRVWGY